jgi:hypothetical protein
MKNNHKQYSANNILKTGIMDEHSSTSHENVIKTTDVSEKNHLLKGNRGWKNYSILAFVAIFVSFGLYVIISSLAAAAPATKTWSTASDWADGTLANTAVAGSSVVLASANNANPSGSTSPDGAIVTNNSASTLIDSSGNKWTVKNGVVYKNGSTAGYSARVTEITYVKNIVWQENASNLWWGWTGNGWTDSNGTSTSPLIGVITASGGTSQNGAVVTDNSGSAITDNASNKWTVKNGIVYKNSATAGYTARVTEIAYVNNVVWQENASNLWWGWTGSGWTNNNGTPTSPLTGVTTTSSGTTAVYDPSGSITLTFNAGTAVSWDSVADDATTPSGTTLATEVRTSTNGSTWSDWTSNVSQAARSQYLQLQANLATTNTAVTPSLTSLSLTYTPPSPVTPSATPATPTPTPIPATPSATPRPSASATPAPTPTPVASSGNCTNPAYTTSSNSSWSNGGYTVQQDMWNNNSGGSQSLYACAFNNWYVVADQPNSGSVKTYPDVLKNYNQSVSSFNTLSTSFADQGPHVGIYEFAYDIWINAEAASGATELMIWNDNYNQYPAGSVVATTTIDGVPFQVYRANSNWQIVSFKAVNATITSGTWNLLPFFTYMEGQGWITSSASLKQIAYGTEVCSTNSTKQTFKVTNFSITSN